MGVAAAMECLQEAKVDKPDAIVTGTAYGCLEDTAVFLSRMVEFKEELLTPTAFIQSTHNTIGAQIGLMLQCNNYNNAFVHRGNSFESALLDAMMLINDDEAQNVLVGGIDEITKESHAILTRMGLYRRNERSNLSLFQRNEKGTIAGEGASFFLMTKDPSGADYAKLDGLTTFYKPAGIPAIEEHIKEFLSSHSIQPTDIDLVIMGRNGDKRFDGVFDKIEKGFTGTPSVNFKHLCGEYPTATGFAMWLAANILRTNSIPDVLDVKPGKAIKRILVYNNYLGINHTLMLLSAC